MFDPDRSPPSSLDEVTRSRFSRGELRAAGLLHFLRGLSASALPYEFNGLRVSRVDSRNMIHIHARGTHHIEIDHVITPQDLEAWTTDVAKAMWDDNEYRLPR